MRKFFPLLLLLVLVPGPAKGYVIPQMGLLGCSGRSQKPRCCPALRMQDNYGEGRRFEVGAALDPKHPTLPPPPFSPSATHPLGPTSHLISQPPNPRHLNTQGYDDDEDLVGISMEGLSAMSGFLGGPSGFTLKFDGTR